MAGKIFLHLLILSIWSQGIIVTFADEEIKEASDFLVRQKRVISHVPGENITIPITSAPHVVIIRHLGRIKCLGNILSQHAAITIASCVEMTPDQYEITFRTTYSNRGPTLNVTGISRYFGHNISGDDDGIALVTVDALFGNTAYSSPIELHTGPLPPGTLGTINGWGFIFRAGEARGTNQVTTLRTIKVPIMSHESCVNTYRTGRPRFELSNKDICTFHARRHSGHTDGGAGLVVDDHLVGVFLHSGGLQGRIDPRYPDVFAFLQDVDYSNWIRTKLESIRLRYERNQH